MKLFYFGSVCANEVFNETVARSKVKPSASAQSFEYALLRGLSEIDGVDITVASAESIATFPGGNRLFLPQRKDALTAKITAQVIPAINLPGIKQCNHARGAEKLLRKWLCENATQQEKCVLVYGLYPDVVMRLQRMCVKYGCRIFAVITDIPATMFTYTKSRNLLKRIFGGAYRKRAVAVQDRFDGYVYLTEAMQAQIAPEKPFVVVEAIADVSVFDGIESSRKAVLPAIMYAGALYKKYGVDLILESFEKVETDCELWLFGSGDYEAEICKKMQEDPRIKFFGRVPREEILRKEKEASLLLNIRNAEDEYTKYSFPSKMIEYMLSGTPVLTTKLPGIPDEYNAYCYTTSARNAASIAQQIDSIFASENAEGMGARARQFVVERKNSSVQARRIVDFLKQETAKVDR